MLRALLPTVLAALVVACSSPEADRLRGQPGADVGNRGSAIGFHAGADPYHGVPCASSVRPCAGPAPVFGP